MRVFLFGLSPWGINIMNLSTEPVQLLLSLLYISSLDASFMFGCVCSRHGFQCILLIQIIDTCVLVPTRYFAFITPLVGEFLTPLDLRVQILELRACELSWLLIRVAQRKCGSSADRPKPFSFWPLARLSSFLFYNLWTSFVLFILVYLFVFSHLCLSIIFL